MADDRAETLPGGWVGALLAVCFLAELALVGGLAWLGVSIGGNVVVSVVLAVVFVAAIVVFWGVWMARTARRRVPDPARLVVEIVLYGGTAVALVAVGHVVPAIVGGVIAIAASVLSRRFAPQT